VLSATLSFARRAAVRAAAGRIVEAATGVLLLLTDGEDKLLLQSRQSARNQLALGGGTSGKRIAAGRDDRRVRVPSQSAEQAVLLGGPVLWIVP
jgi:hypothetical protein